MEQIETLWNNLKHFGTFQEGEQMTEQEQKNELTEQDSETLTPSAIYQNNVYALVDDLKQDKQFQGLTDEEIKNNKAFFPRLIQLLYNDYVGDLLQNKLDYRLKGVKPVYLDIKQLDYLFNIYIDLVNNYKWNNRPSILEFSILTGISRETIYKWINGEISDDEYINNSVSGKGDKRKHITRDYIDTARKWQSICEQSLVDGSGDTIKEIFLLKAKHGYRDQDKRELTVNIIPKQVISAEDLPSLIDLKA